jgi:biotin transporter BioY
VRKEIMKKRKTSTVMLILICIMIILYTAANFALQYFTSIEVSPTLTTAWFAFWGTELVALAAIKTSKLKHNVSQKENIEHDIEEE